MNWPIHCPGLETFKKLESFTCDCPKCGESKEIFSDEFEKSHKCPKCDTEIDFTTCTYSAGAG